MKFLLLLLPLFVLLLISSCGADNDELRREAVLSAKIFLNAGKCNDAIDVLDAAPYGDEDSDFLSTYASAYACRAGYDEITFFLSDVALTASPAILSGTAKYSTSGNMTDALDDNFTDLQVAIDTLLYAGGIAKAKDPTTERRSQKLGATDLKNLESQLFFMILAQMGQYYKYFGNADTTGVKGSGADISNNTCFIDYDSVDTITYTVGTSATGTSDFATGISALNSASLIGGCDGVSKGHGQLITVKRACQGIVLLNNFLALLEVIPDYFAGGALGTLSDIFSTLTPLLNVVTDPNMSDMYNLLSQTRCEAEHSSIDTEIQAYFLFRLELFFN